MKVPWLGPPPSDDPGVPTVATLLIEGLAGAGRTSTCMQATGQTSFPWSARVRIEVIGFPSPWYEPFGLTAAEALACGTPVVASDALGAVEGIDGACYVRSRAGDAAAFEAAARRTLPRMRADPARARHSARPEAVSRFDHVAIARQLVRLRDQTARSTR